MDMNFNKSEYTSPDIKVSEARTASFVCASNVPAVNSTINVDKYKDISSAPLEGTSDILS